MRQSMVPRQAPLSQESAAKSCYLKHPVLLRFVLDGKICRVRQRTVHAGNGRVYLYFYVKWNLGKDPLTGSRRYLEVTGKTPQQVQEKLLRMTGNFPASAAGKPSEKCDIIPTDITFPEWAAIWMSGRLRQHRQLQHLLRHILPWVKQRRLQDIDAMCAADFLIHLQNAEVSSSARAKTWSTFHEILQEAHQQKLLRYDPCCGLHLPESARPHREALDNDEIALLLSLDEADTRNAILKFLLFSGLRISECLGLTWENVDLTEGTLRVRAQLIGCRKGCGAFVIRHTTKSRKERTVFLPVQAVRLLEKLKATAEDVALVFRHPDGRAYRPDEIRKQLRSALSGQRHSNATPHDLRRTAATIAYQATHNIEEVSRMLGHSDTQITSDVYCAASPAGLREAAESIPAYISPANPGQ